MKKVKITYLVNGKMQKQEIKEAGERVYSCIPVTVKSLKVNPKEVEVIVSDNLKSKP